MLGNYVKIQDGCKKGWDGGVWQRDNVHLNVMKLSKFKMDVKRVGMEAFDKEDPVGWITRA